MATLDGKNSHHGLGTIAVANGAFTDVATNRKKIPRLKKVPWSTITPNSGIQIFEYGGSNVPSLNQKKFATIEKVNLKSLSLFLLVSRIS